jgi:hypothetical protein
VQIGGPSGDDLGERVIVGRIRQWGHHTICTKSYAKPKNKRNQMVIRSIGCASDQPQIANYEDFSSNTFSDIMPGGQGDHQVPVTVRFCTNRVVTPI